MKIDVEGAELSVLKGARALIDRRKPSILVECLPGGPVDEIASWFTGRSYRILAPPDWQEVDRVEPDPKRWLRNFLFVPN